jgi:hypothetical protein
MKIPDFIKEVKRKAKIAGIQVVVQSGDQCVYCGRDAKKDLKAAKKMAKERANK